jgi:hypothetical protein
MQTVVNSCWNCFCFQELKLYLDIPQQSESEKIVNRSGDNFVKNFELAGGLGNSHGDEDVCSHNDKRD